MKRSGGRSVLAKAAQARGLAVVLGVAGVVGLTGLAVASALGSVGSRAFPDPQDQVCATPPGLLPDPGRPAGVPDPSIPIEHIVVIMQENHSFDNYFGALNAKTFYGSAIDGFTPDMTQLTSTGAPIRFYHSNSLCLSDTNHQWDPVHQAWDGGKSDRWAVVNGRKVMAHYDERDIPFYYGLANSFATADRYFCSVLGGTDSNRLYLYAGTSFGHVANDTPKNAHQFDQRTIFDALSENHVSWAYYRSFLGNYINLFRPMYRRASREGHIRVSSDFERDLDSGRLPQVAFIEASELFMDEHPASDIQHGQAWVSGHIRALMRSAYWPSSALLLVYDENGGDYDHVKPPKACAPDAIPPMLGAGDMPGAFDQYGMRVPFVAVSPWAKRHYVSHMTYDHTSILRFIERKFNLPALTRRDANANDLSDFFDFSNPNLELPRLPRAKVDVWNAFKCLVGDHGSG